MCHYCPANLCLKRCLLCLFFIVGAISLEVLFLSFWGLILPQALMCQHRLVSLTEGRKNEEIDHVGFGSALGE
ncbi:hypothetical protein ACRRTK_011818 [Alexandromys fortis]